MKESEPKFKWANPAEYLIEQINEEWDADEIRATLVDIILNTDSDTLQDMFQDEMSKDGYFDPIDEEATDADTQAT